MMLKLKDLAPGECSVACSLPDDKKREMEAMVIAMLKGALPEEAWALEVRLKVTVNVKHKPNAHFWTIDVPTVGGKSVVTSGMVDMNVTGIPIEKLPTEEPK